eukprot:352648-Chlamydomonas_euryale.AAC.3
MKQQLRITFCGHCCAAAGAAVTAVHLIAYEQYGCNKVWQQLFNCKRSSSSSRTAGQDVLLPGALSGVGVQPWGGITCKACLMKALPLCLLGMLARGRATADPPLQPLLLAVACTCWACLLPGVALFPTCCLRHDPSATCGNSTAVLHSISYLPRLTMEVSLGSPGHSPEEEASANLFRQGRHVDALALRCSARPRLAIAQQRRDGAVQRPSSSSGHQARRLRGARVLQ